MKTYSRNEAKVEQLFDHIGSEFDSRDATFLNHYEQMSTVCQTSFTDKEIEDKIILDAGCGTGTAAIYFARNRGRQVIGVDLSLKSLAVGSRWSAAYKLGNVIFQQANLLNLPFKDGYFDITFSCGAIPYIMDTFAAVKELIRVTKKDGIIVLFLLKKSRLDKVCEIARFLLSRCSVRVAGLLASIMSIVMMPLAGMLLQRDVRLKRGKPLSQTILESLFSPIALGKVNPDMILNYFMRRGFCTEEVKGINDVDFYSSKTIFICKATKL